MGKVGPSLYNLGLRFFDFLRALSVRFCFGFDLHAGLSFTGLSKHYVSQDKLRVFRLSFFVWFGISLVWFWFGVSVGFSLVEPRNS